MTNSSIILDYTECPFCGSVFSIENNNLACTSCNRKFEIKDGIPDLMGELTNDTELSLSKWEQIYSNESYMQRSEKDTYELWHDITLRQIKEYSDTIDSTQKRTYLEIGCGVSYVGETMAKQGWFFVGIDFSIKALKALQSRLNSRGIKNYLLIHGDIQSLPIRKNSIDLIYGGGVIEHFKNTELITRNMYKVLKNKGIAINSVPYFNVGSFAYRSLWGGIPDVPVLKQLAELIHIKLLGGKHMVFGYELQFPASALRKYHIAGGFNPKFVCVEKMDVPVQLHFIKNKYLRKFFIHLCKNNRLFWPAVMVIGRKQ